ncbi:MAG: RNase adapter RapZ [Ruminococcaceae bacterium]|nr:RNase adapter RapZ [Oscillospiraceae bacterium]
MEFIIISGLSGAGKSRAASVLEDMQFYCVDNMPVTLLPQFAQLCLATGGVYEKVALVTDIRDKDGFPTLIDSLGWLDEKGIKYRILFLEADSQSILMRYRETRRPHPLEGTAPTITEAIQREKALLSPVRNMAEHIINTSGLSLARLKQHLSRIIFDSDYSETLSINIIAFGFKHGTPTEADFVFDVRFLPNPFYDEKMRDQTGLDADVKKYIFSFPAAEKFVYLTKELLEFSVPNFLDSGRLTLNVAIGCTGGRHRSVSIAERLASVMSDNKNVNVSLVFRDIDRR